MKNLSIALLILIPLTGSIIVNTEYPVKQEMNACGVSFDLSETDFRREFQKTMIGAMYSVDLVISNEKIRQIHCVMNMRNKDDVYYVYSNTICYIYSVQQGITKIVDNGSEYTFIIGIEGLVQVNLLDNGVDLLFIKNKIDN